MYVCVGVGERERLRWGGCLSPSPSEYSCGTGVCGGREHADGVKLIVIGRAENAVIVIEGLKRVPETRHNLHNKALD